MRIDERRLCVVLLTGAAPVKINYSCWRTHATALLKIPMSGVGLNAALNHICIEQVAYFACQESAMVKT